MEAPGGQPKTNSPSFLVNGPGKKTEHSLPPPGLNCLWSEAWCGEGEKASKGPCTFLLGYPGMKGSLGIGGSGRRAFSPPAAKGKSLAPGPGSPFLHVCVCANKASPKWGQWFLHQPLGWSQQTGNHLVNRIICYIATYICLCPNVTKQKFTDGSLSPKGGHC